MIEACFDGIDVKLSSGETVKVRPLSLGVLQKALRGLDKPGDVKLEDLLKAPSALAGLCGKEEEWFNDLPMQDALTIAETVVEVSDLEAILPRFFALRDKLTKVLTKAR